MPQTDTAVAAVNTTEQSQTQLTIAIRPVITKAVSDFLVVDAVESITVENLSTCLLQRIYFDVRRWITRLSVSMDTQQCHVTSVLYENRENVR